MPLSDHEQRLLEQMERALYAEDPKFATTLRSGNVGVSSRSRLASGAAAVLGGLAVLMYGVISTTVLIGIAGFLVMLGGVFLVFSSLRRGTAKAAKSTKAAKKRGSVSLNTRMQGRWAKRREDGTF